MGLSSLIRENEISVEQGIELAAMAVRESIMHYFKGDMVEFIVDRVNAKAYAEINITEHGLPPEERQYTYQRRNIQLRNRKMLYFNSTPLLQMQQNPHRVIFYDKFVAKSPQIQSMVEMVEEAVKKYLPGVEITHDTETEVM